MRSVRRGFALFGAADAARSGMRATGNYGTGISNYGDCDATLLSCQNNRIALADGLTQAPFHDIEWAYGVPPSEYRKIRDVTPSVANATGGGWMAGYNRTVLGLPKRFGPRDGTLGSMFSGVTGTSDVGCRDHTGFRNGSLFGGGVGSVGLPLLPTSDCPETWGSEGWRGAHPIDQDGWQALLELRGPRFSFDFWRVPEQYQRRDRPFLGTNHHTYGETSDYNTEVLANYGHVVPGGAGAPRYQGYPLGLLIRFEAFNFGQPTVNSAYFVQATIVNRSRDVWGHEIDYDSLYLGLAQGTLFGTDNNSRYAVPDRGMVVYHQSGVQGNAGPCGDAFRLPYSSGCTGGSAAGYGRGAAGIIFLKSPLGDLRNKLFTRTASGDPCATGVDPFCNPSHPLAGDTITFNRQTFGDFGGADAYTWGTSVRAAFGLLSATEDNTLDGRNLQDANDRTLYNTFRSEDWPTNKAHYNKYLPPGNWDYNKDGVLDTLALDTCGRLGCVDVDSDTMPGGWLNKRGNVGGLQSFGPFSLAAGDTTSLVYAVVGEADSVQFWNQVHAVLDLYLEFYLTADAPPPARIVATQITPGTDEAGTLSPRVRFFLSDDAERWVDPYLAKLADDLETAAPGTQLGELAALNPGLADQVRTRAADNVERLEIYKSCDGGETFTGDADCDGDRTADVDGSHPGLGWQAYAILDAEAGAGLPNTFEDASVQDGRSYLYVVVGKSRGATFVVNTASGSEQLTFAPSFRNALSRSTRDPNVASIYVPVSRPAGYRPTEVDFTARPGGTTVPFIVDPMDAVRGGAYRAIFGNEIVVTRDSIPGEPVTSSTVIIRRRAFVDAAGVRVDSVIRRESFVYAGQGFPVVGTGTPGAPFPGPGVIHLPTTYAGLGFVLVGPDGPVFGTTTLTGSRATPLAAVTESPSPGFVIIADNAVAGTFDPASETQVRGDQSIAEQRLTPADTAVPRDLVNSFMAQWREESSRRTADARGVYEVAWRGDPFGTNRGFALDLERPAATEAELHAALEARLVGSIGVTDATTAALLGVEQTDLVPVRVPFTVRNVSAGRAVDVAMLPRVHSRIVLGSMSDTISVGVPAHQWVPGDTLLLIETIVEDSTTAFGLVLGADGTPVQRERRAVTFRRAVLGCNQVRESCNPVLPGTRGASGYLPMRAGDRTRFGYHGGFAPTDEFAFEVTPAVTGGDIASLTDSSLARIRVVPNPFVLYSRYQRVMGDPRVVFTNVPPRGTLRIYTIAGQLVQQITWEPADLQGDGDLFWNLRTMDDERVASGLYLWVLTTSADPTDPTSPPLRARGKMVVIQGDAN